jgi:predicted DCC family thiol-disulfide oxidoreductase YuxK
VINAAGGDAKNGYYSVFLIDEKGRIYERSDAILTTLVSLGGPNELFRLLWLVPRPIRDLAYRFVARWRYRIFGTKTSCRIPTPEERAMFLVDAVSRESVPSFTSTGRPAAARA